MDAVPSRAHIVHIGYISTNGPFGKGQWLLQSLASLAPDMFFPVEVRPTAIAKAIAGPSRLESLGSGEERKIFYIHVRRSYTFSSFGGWRNRDALNRIRLCELFSLQDRQRRSTTNSEHAALRNDYSSDKHDVWCWLLLLQSRHIARDFPRCLRYRLKLEALQQVDHRRSRLSEIAKPAIRAPPRRCLGLCDTAQFEKTIPSSIMKTLGFQRSKFIARGIQPFFLRIRSYSEATMSAPPGLSNLCSQKASTTL